MIMKDKYIRIIGGGHVTHVGSTSAFTWTHVPI